MKNEKKVCYRVIIYIFSCVYIYAYICVQIRDLSSLRSQSASNALNIKGLHR